MTYIHLVTTPQDLKRFINLPYQKYQNTPNWVAPLRMAETEIFDEAKNPFFDHARMDLFLAETNGKVVGRIAAIDDDLHNKTHHDNLLFFGFFEADTLETANLLFEAVEKRSAALGRGRIRGPVNPSMNDGAGFQINAFDTLPYLMMPQNPADYPSFAEAAGYSKIKDLYAWRLHANKGVSERIGRLAERVSKRLEYTLKPLSMKMYEQEVERILTFYNEHWEDNWGQVPYTQKEAKKLANDLKLIIDPNMVLFLEIEGKLAGITVGFPNANQVFAKIKGGKLLPLGWWHLLKRKKLMTTIRLPILGVIPEYRNKGLELLMIHAFAREGIKRGYTECECSWELEDNDGINKSIAATGADQYKTYRLYQKDLIAKPLRRK